MITFVENSYNNQEIKQYMTNLIDYVRLLERNYNLVLNGAPGTGKTYLARQIAAHIIFKGDVPENFEEHPQFIEQCGFVQFHPSYDYTDFVEGLRPTPPNEDGNIGFERMDGIFKAFSIKAISIDNNSMELPIGLESDKETNDNGSPFLKAYQKLLQDIGSNRVVLYSDFRPRMMTEINILICNGGLQYATGGAFRDAQLAYLKKIYEHYYSRGIFDIRSERFDDFVKIIGNTLDYSYYRGIVQGLLDRTDKNTVIEEKVSSSALQDAESNAIYLEKPYIFIIDEINRGEISKIFGELFFSIDPGYRGKKGKVQTQYQNLITDEGDPFKDGFYIPDNVYIIGTMNDIDRSVECMDFAMRRRFTFKEITAKESAKNMELSDGATERMTSLNNAISEIEGLNSSFHIGAAYFKDEEDYKALWNLKLEGLLKEYLRGMPDAEESLETLRKAYYLDKE